jgi:predicted Zn-dependent protease
VKIASGLTSVEPGAFSLVVQQLGPPDSHHLDAAIGWLGLGCVAEAQAELRVISAANQKHPAVLEVRWTVCAREKLWTEALHIAQNELAAAPDDACGWLHRAYALRRVPDGGLSRAWTALLPAAEKFPTEPIIAYNLSCYACQMQQLDIARHWLRQAMKIGGQEAIRKMALADDDLKPLWTEIREQ